MQPVRCSAPASTRTGSPAPRRPSAGASRSSTRRWSTCAPSSRTSPSSNSSDPRGMPFSSACAGAVPRERILILDAKRGDMANTASAYARALFDVLGADCVTVNPLLGGDSLAPFLEREGRGILVVARSSNPGAADLLDARLETGVPVSLRIVELGLSLDPGGAVGLRRRSHGPRRHRDDSGRGAIGAPAAARGRRPGRVTRGGGACRAGRSRQGGHRLGQPRDRHGPGRAPGLPPGVLRERIEGIRAAVSPA